MSRQEIDRILGNDFSELDNNINKQMQFFQLITGQISEDSSFLTQFQKMLQKQIGEPVEIQHQNTEVNAQQECKQEHLNQEEESVQKIAIQSGSIVGEKPPNYNIHEKANNMKKYSELRQKLTQFQQFVKLMIHSLAGFLEEQKQLIVTQFREHIEIVIELTRKKFDQKVHSLQKQNKELQDQLQTFRNNKAKESLHEVQRIINSQNMVPNIDLSQTFRTGQRQSKNRSFNPRYQIKQTNFTLIDSNPYSYDSVSFQFGRGPSSNSRQRQDSTDLSSRRSMSKSTCPMVPEIKPVCVGATPVKNGFGQLTSGAKVIYRGMWKDGKFQGKGKLTWNNYTYEGDFQKGMFEGFGRLETSAGTYIGKFRHNRAEGEGTYNTGHAKLSGLWSGNSMLKPY